MSEPRPGSDPTQQSGGYPPNTDPAYSGQYWSAGYYGQGAPVTQPAPQPTEQMPPYWQPGMGYPPGPPPPPPPPKSTRWLWIAAGAAVLLVTALVAVLVMVSMSSRDSTIVAPPTAQNGSPIPPRLTLPPTTLPLPTATARPVPAPTVPTSDPTVPTGPPETVVYSVTGEGRAINITYVDTDGVMQTEFNVALPWSKEVTLSSPAKNSASVAVVNVGRDVTCSVTVNGAQVRQRSGRGLTICTGIG